MENNDLAALKLELEAWRASKNRGRFIPDEIWQKAASLAKAVGVNPAFRQFDFLLTS